jgi:UDPglucose--hexose-1-phosphate uridylyltransferase
MSSLLRGPHRRYNPLLDEWVLCSPHRLERPWQGQTEASSEERRPAHDPNCYLCPGNTRANGQRNPSYTSTFAFDNDFPALRPAAGDPPLDVDGLLVARPETGRCRVVCFSPRHDLTLAEMDQSAVRLVIDTWAEELTDLGSRDDVAHVQLFENKGAIMGCSNPHPHCQLWAQGQIPEIPSRKLRTQRAWFARRGDDLLGEYLRLEISAGERLVFRNDHWVALVPFWAVWPFETMLLPLRRVPDLPSLTGEERDALAEALRHLTIRYDNLFRCSFPYSMGWHGRPTDGEAHPYWRLHAVYYPPLLRSASVRKFLVGYELTSEPQRDLTAELAAERLRAMPSRHYRETP